MKAPLHSEDRDPAPAPDNRIYLNGKPVLLAPGEPFRNPAAGGQPDGTDPGFADREPEQIREHNRTVALERLTDCEKRLRILRAEQARRLGKEALGTAEEDPGVARTLSSSLEKLRDELTSDMTEAQVRLFDPVFRNRARGVAAWGQRHEDEQRGVWRTTAVESFIAGQTERLLDGCEDPEESDRALDNIDVVLRGEAELRGLDPEHTRRMQRQARQKALYPALETLIGKGGLERARDLLTRFSEDLGPETASGYAAGINAAERIQARKREFAALREREARERAEAEAGYRRFRSLIDQLPPADSLEEREREAENLLRELRGATPDSGEQPEGEGKPDEVLRRYKADLAHETRMRDARDMAGMLNFRQRMRKNRFSPSRILEELEGSGLSERAAALLRRGLIEGTTPEPDEDNTDRTMDLLRAIDRSRAGGNPVSEQDVLAAALRGNLTDSQTLEALRYLGSSQEPSASRLDDLCLDLHFPASENGQVRAPAWLYAGVRADLIRNGLLTDGPLPRDGNRPLTDEILAASMTRVNRRREAALAARGLAAGDGAGAESGKRAFPPDPLEFEAKEQRGRDLQLEHAGLLERAREGDPEALRQAGLPEDWKGIRPTGVLRPVTPPPPPDPPQGGYSKTRILDLLCDELKLNFFPDREIRALRDKLKPVFATDKPNANASSVSFQAGEAPWTQQTESERLAALREKYPHQGHAYLPKAFALIRDNREAIRQAAQDWNVPVEAVAGALADEYSTSEGVKKYWDIAQVGWAYAGMSLQAVRESFAEGRHGLLTLATQDIGPGNFKVRTGLRLFEHYVLGTQEDNPIKRELYRHVSPQATAAEKWEGFKKHLMLTAGGTAQLGAAEIALGEKLLAPFMTQAGPEERAAILMSWYKQGPNYLKRYLDNKAGLPPGQWPDIGVGEGNGLLRYWDTLHEALQGRYGPTLEERLDKLEKVI